MKKIFLILFLLTSVFADEEKYFTTNDEVIDSVCIPQCRQVKDNYVSLVTGFNPKSGMTYCSIHPKNDLTKTLGINANTKNQNCIKLTNQKVDITKLKSYKKDDMSSLVNLNFQPQQLTLSRFLAGVVTLDPALIDFETTTKTGLLSLNNPTAIYGTNTVDVKGNEELVATADSFNKANLAYYSSIYTKMSNVYKALQYMLLVVVGSYFFIVLTIKRANDQLESASDRQKVLNTVLIPVVAIIVFLIPIPEQGGLSGSVIQKIMRAGASYSNKIADEVGNIGANSYLSKLYSSVGAYTVDGEKVFKENDINLNNSINFYEKAYKECKDRFADISSFMNPPDGAENFNFKKIDEKYTFSGCQYIEHELKANYTLRRQNKVLLDAIESNIGNSELTNTLTQINKNINDRQNELGWINSTILPAMSILIENISTVADNSVANKTVEENKKLIEKASNNRADKNQKARNSDGFTGFLGNLKDDFDVALGEVAGKFLGSLAYLTLPGAGEIFSLLKPPENGDGIVAKIANLIPVSKLKYLGFSFIKDLLSTVGNEVQLVIAVMLVALIYTTILSYIPIVVSIVAGALAFLGYLIELAKYFYVAPFITAFSLTTGKTNKIAEFLVTGIALFLKPILIVVFIYFALFIYGIFIDVFMTYAIEQFTGMKELQSQVWLTAITFLFMALLQIVSAIGATYMFWKIVLQAPSWVFRMVGLNDSGANFATEQLGQRLERYSFQL